MFGWKIRQIGLYIYRFSLCEGKSKCTRELLCTKIINHMKELLCVVFRLNVIKNKNKNY